MFGYHLEACSFLIRDSRGVDPEGREDGEEVGVAEGGESVILIYSLRKKKIFIYFYLIYLSVSPESRSGTICVSEARRGHPIPWNRIRQL